MVGLSGSGDASIPISDNDAVLTRGSSTRSKGKKSKAKIKAWEPPKDKKPSKLFVHVKSAEGLIAAGPTRVPAM